MKEKEDYKEKKGKSLEKALKVIVKEEKITYNLNMETKWDIKQWSTWMQALLLMVGFEVYLLVGYALSLLNDTVKLNNILWLTKYIMRHFHRKILEVSVD